MAVKQGQSSRSQGSQLGALLSLSGLSKKTIVLVGSTITNSTGLMTNLLTVSNFQGTFVFFWGGGIYKVADLSLFGNKATDSTYRSKYWFPEFGFDSGPNSDMLDLHRSYEL